MKEKGTKITDFFTLIVFAAFAMCVLLVLLFGAKVYRSLVMRGKDSFEARTAAQYVTMRVHQAEHVTVADFDGCEALVLSETIDGETYLTRVYCYDGFLRELFSAENAALTPEDGEKILPAEGLDVSVAEDLLTVQLDEQRVFLHLLGKGAAS